MLLFRHEVDDKSRWKSLCFRLALATFLTEILFTIEIHNNPIRFNGKVDLFLGCSHQLVLEKAL